MQLNGGKNAKALQRRYFPPGKRAFFSDLHCISRPQFTGSHFPQTTYCGFVCHVVFYKHKSGKAGRGHQETERAVCFALLENMCGSRPKG